MIEYQQGVLVDVKPGDIRFQPESLETSERPSTPASHREGSVGPADSFDASSFGTVQKSIQAPTVTVTITFKLESIEAEKKTKQEEFDTAIKPLNAEAAKFSNALSKYQNIDEKDTSSFTRWRIRTFSPTKKLGLSDADVKTWNNWVKTNPKSRHRDWLDLKSKEANKAVSEKQTLHSKNITGLEFEKETYSLLEVAVKTVERVEQAAASSFSPIMGQNAQERVRQLSVRATLIDQHLSALRSIKSSKINSLAQLKARKFELEYNGKRSELANRTNTLRTSNNPRFSEVEIELDALLESFKNAENILATKVGEVVIQDDKTKEYQQVLAGIKEEEGKQEKPFKDEIAKRTQDTIHDLELAKAQINFTKMAVKLEETAEQLKPGTTEFDAKYEALNSEAGKLNLYDQAKTRLSERYPDSNADPIILYEKSRPADNARVTLRDGSEITDGSEIFEPEILRLNGLLKEKNEEHAAILKARIEAKKYAEQQQDALLFDIPAYRVTSADPEIRQLVDAASSEIINMISTGADITAMKQAINARLETCKTALKTELPKAQQRAFLVTETKERRGVEDEGMSSLVAMQDSMQFAMALESDFSKLANDPLNPHILTNLKAKIKDNEKLTDGVRTALNDRIATYERAVDITSAVRENRFKPEMIRGASDSFLELAGRMLENASGVNTKASTFLDSLGLEKGLIGNWSTTNFANVTYTQAEAVGERSYQLTLERAKLLRSFCEQRLKSITSGAQNSLRQECETDLAQLTDDLLKKIATQPTNVAPPIVRFPGGGMEIQGEYEPTEGEEQRSATKLATFEKNFAEFEKDPSKGELLIQVLNSPGDLTLEDQAKLRKKTDVYLQAASIAKAVNQGSVDSKTISNAGYTELEVAGRMLANRSAGKMSASELLKHLGLATGFTGNWFVYNDRLGSSDMPETFNLDRKQATFLKSFSEQRLRLLSPETDRAMREESNADLEQLEDLNKFQEAQKPVTVKL